MDVDRDHIVVRPWWYSVMVFLEMAITAGILCLIFPYTGPENRLPGLHRFCIFVAITTFVINFYYLFANHFFAPIYSCWAWLILLCWAALVWITVWVDITLAMGRMATGDDEDPEWGINQLNKYIIATGIGALNVVFSTAMLVSYARALHRHRRAGRPYVFHGRWRPVDPEPRAKRNPNLPRHIALPVQNYELAERGGVNSTNPFDAGFPQSPPATQPKNMRHSKEMGF